MVIMTCVPDFTEVFPVTHCMQKVEQFVDYLSVIKTYTDSKILGPDVPFGVIIGCSGHSPVPKAIFEPVVEAIATNVLAPNKITTVWYGGDPTFRSVARGGNIADILSRLKVLGHLQHVGAVQREDWIDKTPAFVDLKVGYSQKLAFVGSQKTFGGYEQQAPTGWTTFTDALTKVSVCKGLLTTPATPVGASAGYLCALPSACRELVAIVILQAGTISLKELEYLSVLLKHSQGGSDIKIYGVTWNSIGKNLNDTELTTKCKLTEIRALMDDLVKKFPEKVFFVNVDSPTDGGGEGEDEGKGEGEEEDRPRPVGRGSGVQGANRGSRGTGWGRGRGRAGNNRGTRGRGY